MLRTALLAVSALVAGVAFVCLLAGQSQARVPAIWAGLLFIAVLLERWRYQTRQGPMGDDWIKTEERFVDPETGRVMQVFYRPGTGERRYEAMAD